MEKILNRIIKIEEELKKEREINRTLQFQIADMNEKIEQITNDFEKKLILSKEEFQLFLENQKSYINNIIENNNLNIETIDYMIVDKNIFKDFALGHCSQEEFDLFIKNKDKEIIYYKNISNYCSYIITNDNKLYGKYSFNLIPTHNNYFIINVSNNFLINKKLNKNYIELFDITIKNIYNLAVMVSQRGSANSSFERIEPFCSAIWSSFNLLKELYGEIQYG